MAGGAAPRPLVLEAALRDKVGGCPSFATSRLAPAMPSC